MHCRDWAGGHFAGGERTAPTRLVARFLATRVEADLDPLAGGLPARRLGLRVDPQAADREGEPGVVADGQHA
jgi:hypothetical protein